VPTGGPTLTTYSPITATCAPGSVASLPARAKLMADAPPDAILVQRDTMSTLADTPTGLGRARSVTTRGLVYEPQATRP
jgi:hypothetical protein